MQIERSRRRGLLRAFGSPADGIPHGLLAVAIFRTTFPLSVSTTETSLDEPLAV